MTAQGGLLAALLAWGVLTLWIDALWAWAAMAMGIFALAAWRALTGRPPALSRPLLPLGAAALWPLLQLALGTTVYRQATWQAALDWGVFALVFGLAQDQFRDRATRFAFLQGAALFGMLVAAVGTVGNAVCPGKVFCLFNTGFQGEVIGPFVNRNQYCAWVELLLPAALYLTGVHRRRRALFGAAAVVMAASVVASASRAGIALAATETAVVLAALAVRHRGDRRRLAWGAVQFAALCAVAVAAVGWQTAAARWGDSTSESLRRDAVRASLEMLQARLWMGSGLGTWSRVYPRYAAVDQGVFLNQAHNDWVQWAAEGGLPFFLFIFFFAALLWKPAVRSIYGVGMVAFLLHALVDYPMQQRPALAACFFCMAGVVSRWREDSEP